MSLFSQNAFVLGCIVFFSTSLTLLLYAWMARAWRIKITEYKVCPGLGPNLVKRKIGNVSYALGWIPSGTSARLLGFDKDSYEMLPVEDRPYAYFMLPGWKKWLFHVSPLLIWTLLLVISLFMLSDSGNIAAAAQEMTAYILTGIKALSGSVSKPAFADATKTILQGKNIVPFVMVPMFFLFVVAAALSKITDLIEDGNTKWKGSKAALALKFIITLFLLYVMLWKIPSFIFSFLSFSQSVNYVVSFMLGMYVVALATYLLLLVVAGITVRRNE